MSTPHPTHSIAERLEQAITQAEWLPAEDIPSPYRDLLCHERDMTSTLADYHRGEVTLTVKSAEQAGEQYHRTVELRVAGQLVEKGWIEISLENFPDDLRRKILAGGRPLGSLLNDSGLTYRSQPQGFFRTPNGKFPYGRYNLLSDIKDRPLARIIEILPAIHHES